MNSLILRPEEIKMETKGISDLIERYFMPENPEHLLMIFQTA